MFYVYPHTFRNPDTQSVKSFANISQNIFQITPQASGAVPCFHLGLGMVLSCLIPESMFRIPAQPSF